MAGAGVLAGVEQVAHWWLKGRLTDLEAMNLIVEQLSRKEEG